MSRQNKQPKNEKAIKPLSDHDFIEMFLRGKYKDAPNPTMKMVRHKNGGMDLMYKPIGQLSLQFSKLATRGRVGDKEILLLNPAVGSEYLFNIIFGVYGDDNVYWTKGFLPLNRIQCSEILNESIRVKKVKEILSGPASATKSEFS